jgi:Restriction endonuclease AspBHI N-terminal/Restriction endonuclease
MSRGGRLESGARAWGFKTASHLVPFADLETADLVLDAVYEGGTKGNLGDEPIGKLLPVGNQGGFRPGKHKNKIQFLVLFTSGEDLDWPDSLDQATGLFVYYGDNKTPGRALHDTQRKGNVMLRDIFEALHATPPRRQDIPPIFVFEKAGVGRSVIFRGLAVPGSPQLNPYEDLVAIWKTTRGERFQNYRATFSILESASVSRTWISDLTNSNPATSNAPTAWLDWMATGRYAVLRAEPTHLIRTRVQQLPETAEDFAILETTVGHFRTQPYAFERCAARLWQMAAPNVSTIDVTRPSRDGGRDAIGLYSVAQVKDPLFIDFALEAKCYSTSHSVGVKETSRLISRLKHRQFGVLVTTSYVAQQAYEEIREDGHPIVIMAGRDVVDTLKQHGVRTDRETGRWLDAEFGS